MGRMRCNAGLTIRQVLERGHLRGRLQVLPRASLLLAIGSLAAVVGFSGCAAKNDLSREPALAVQTESDQTEADRRARVRLQLASAYYGRGQFDTALDEAKQALQVTPQGSLTAADAYGLMGLIYGAMDQEKLADESFRRALAINPRDASVLHNQGWMACQRNRFDDAQRLFDRALAIPGYRDVARTQLGRGVCLARNNQWAEAEVALMRAYELDPGNPAVGFSLAEVLLKRGEVERARFYIGRVNDTPDAANAQTLWLAARIEHKAGRGNDLRLLGDQLRNRYPQSPEAALYDRGQFDE